MDKIGKFRLNANLCKPHSNINHFFAKTYLSKWDHVDIFARFVYDESPSTTPQRVLDIYNRNLFDIISTKDTNNNVMQHVRDIIAKMDQAKCLKIIGDTLLNIRKSRAKQRVNLTNKTREDFQTAETNDRMNQKADIYADWNNEDNFFQASSSGSEITGNKTNEEDEESSDHIHDDFEASDLDTQDAIKEEVKDATSAKENQNGPFRMREQNRMEFTKSYRAMDESYMWKLSSGRIVEEELFKLGNDLEFEHAIHSFILDVEDELIMEHFTEKELEEIEGTTIPEVPDLSDEIDDFLGKFLGKTNLNEIRQIIKESMFGNDYNREKHHDEDYICLALYSLVREIENGNLKNANLENWYNCHVWNIIFDQAFGDVQAVTVVRGESTSVSTATRKNKKAKRKPGERRKIGRRGDWILRAVGNGNKDEFGAGEAGKDWTDKYGTKYLKEIGLKLPKTLKDMLMNLMEKVNWVKEVRKNIQTVGIIHEGLMMALVYADNPKGYVCRFRRSQLMEVPDTAEKFDSILTILASILTAKSAIQMTIEMTQTKRQAVKSSFRGVGYRKRPREDHH
ncbi:hypothetical protein RclHR1_08520014 [Rhizophagus clarus]|nr:hypothetical protein RclHR1_08520014 [Rhizophagus clarus]